MNNPAHTFPGDLVSSLALDAAKPLYSRLHVPLNDENFEMHRFLKEAVEYSEFAEQHILWDKVVSHAETMLSEQERHTWLEWIFNAFTGTHPPDVDLSGWLMALDHYHLPHANWEKTGMHSNEIELTKDFIDSYFAVLDEPGFNATLEACRARPLTEWDKRMHQAYGFVYFDRSSGADPFLNLTFVNQGEALRRTLRTYPFDAVSDFPHSAFREAAQALIDQRNVWMPEARKLSPLIEVQ